MRERGEYIACDKPDHLQRSIANQPNHLKSRRVKELLRIDRSDDENLYQPRLHSRRVREIHEVSQRLEIPMTVILDQAVEIYLENERTINNNI